MTTVPEAKVTTESSPPFNDPQKQVEAPPVSPVSESNAQPAEDPFKMGTWTKEEHEKMIEGNLRLAYMHSIEEIWKEVEANIKGGSEQKPCTAKNPRAEVV